MSKCSCKKASDECKESDALGIIVCIIGVIAAILSAKLLSEIYCTKIRRRYYDVD